MGKINYKWSFSTAMLVYQRVARDSKSEKKLDGGMDG